MKSSASDIPGWDGTNSSGFSGLPAGYRDYDGSFSYVGASGFWWSSSPASIYAWSREIYPSYVDVYRSNSNVSSGFSVRCVRD